MQIPTVKPSVPADGNGLPTPRLRVYALAAALAGAALLLRLNITAWVGDRPVLILFVIPIIVSAYVGGVGPGLLCTALTGLGTAWFVMPPINSFIIDRPLDVAQWLLTLLCGLLISILTGDLHRTRARAAHPAADRVEVQARRRVQAGFGVALAGIGLLGVAAFVAVARMKEDSAWVDHTRDVIARLNRLYAEVTDAQNGDRGYAITGNHDYLESYRRAVTDIPTVIDRVRHLTSDNPEQQHRLDVLAPIIESELSIASEVITARREGGLARAEAVLQTRRGKQLHDRMFTIVEEMKRVEEDLLTQRTAQANRTSVLTQAVTAGGGVLAFGFVAVALFQVRRDFGARQRAVLALQRSEERLHFIFEAVPMGISFAMTARDGTRHRLINDAHLRLCGLTRAEVEDAGNWSRATHPDDRPRQAKFIEALEAGTINHYAIDKRYVHADGRIVWVMLTFQRRHHPDGSYEDLSVAVDITERKRAIAELETFFAVSLDFLCIASGDGFFKRVSPAVTDVLGWSVEEFLATPYATLVHPDDLPATLREVELQLKQGHKVMHFENRYRHKDGAWRILSWRSMPQPDGLMYATARDVTELREAQGRIDLQNTELEATNKELEAFSYSVSHDLRAPLRHIIGFASMLERDVQEHLPENSQRFLKNIVASAERMNELIDALLAFSRAGRVPLNVAEVDLNPLVADIQQDLELGAQGRRIEWTFTPMPPVRGDRALLRQIFANLLENAVKYTRGRDPALIQVGALDDDKDQVVLFVKDNGAGFDMKYSDNLFGVFQRLHRPDEFEGHGIGLANVRRIATRHGGRVWAEAAPDRGATFFVALPRAGISSRSTDATG